MRKQEAKGGKYLPRHPTKEDIHMTNKHMKRCPTLYVIRDCKFKGTLTYYSILFQCLKS